MIHQLHELLILAVLFVRVVYPWFSMRLDYVMIRLLQRLLAAVTMIIPVMAAAAAA